MHFLLASILLPLCATGDERAHDASHAPAEPLLARVYDLGGLERTRPVSQDTVLLPYLEFHRHQRGLAFAEMALHYGLEDQYEESANLLASLLGEDLHASGSHWSLGPGGRWLLIAPETTQRRAADSLALLERHLGATVRLRIDLIDGGEGPGETDGPVRASSEEVDALVRAAREAGTLRTLSLDLRSGQSETIDLSSTLWSVFGHEAEVAQLMVASAPYIALVPVGLRLSLRASPGRNGVHLAGIVQDSSLREPHETRRIARSGLLALDSGQTQVSLPGVYSRLALERRAFTLNAHLGRAEALILSSELGTAPVQRRRLLIMRVEAGELPRMTALGEHGGRLNTLFDSGAAAPALAQSLGLLDGRLQRPRAFDSALEPLLAARIVEGDPQLLDELIDSGDFLCDQEALGPQRLMSCPSDAPMPDLAGMLELLAPPAQNLELRFVLRRSGTGAALASGSLPISPGRRASLLLGTESTRVVAYSPTIAQAASAAEPIVASIFDGLVLQVRTRVDAEGRALVELDAYVNLLDEDASLALGTPFMERIDTPRLQTLFAGRTLPADGELHYLGDEGTAEGGLVLEVRAR